MFTRVQHALTRADRSHIHLTADVHNNLEAFHNLFRSLTSRPIHLRKLHNFPLTWMGTTGASGSGMGGVCRDQEGQYFFWSYPFSPATQAHLMSSSNPMET